MSPRTPNTLVSLQTEELDSDVIKHVWTLVIEYAIEERRANRYSAQISFTETTVPRPVLNAHDSLLEYSSQKWFRLVARWARHRGLVNEATRLWIGELGPYFENMTLLSNGIMVAAISEGGAAIDIVVTVEQWERLRRRISTEVGLIPLVETTLLEDS